MDIEAKRGRFEVIDRGGREHGTQPVLVLLHAFPLASEQWSADAEALASRGLRVIAPSMRGFGGTPPAPGSLSIDAMADDVAAILDALGVTEPVVLGGLSMGGYVTLAFARRHPERLRGLVLADTRAEPDGDEARANRDKAIARVEGGDVAGYVEGLLAVLLSPVTRAERPDIVERAREMAMRASASSLTTTLRALRDRPDARPGLSSIAVPVLAMAGADDTVTPPSAAQAMAAAIPGGRASVHVLPHAGHLSNLEQPAAFRDAVASFVARLTDRR
jgi:pimeloyl-ACP methyl ester carboxylesterase